MATAPIPEGLGSPIPYLFMQDAARATDWYVANLGGTEKMRMTAPTGGVVMHAEVELNGRVLMLSEANPERGTRAPDPAAPSASKVMLYVEDVDAVVARCRANGATVVMEPVDQFWGDRMAEIRDPFGHAWYLATAKEVVPPAELETRMKAMLESQP